MNTSGEAADQVVRMSMEVGEAALKISGAGAKQLAVLLYAILKEQKKTKGRARLETLVRSGKPLTVFSVRESDLKKFVQEAKRYGILYCAVRTPRGSKDGMADVMVKEEDAPRINRIVERFQFASVAEAAQVKTEIEKARADKGKQKADRTQEAEGQKSDRAPQQEQTPGTGNQEKGKQPEKGEGQAEPEQGRPGKSKEDALMEELFGEEAGQEGKTKNPFMAKTEKSHPSEPTSRKRGKAAEGTSKPQKGSMTDKPSVREALKEIQAARKQEADTPKQEAPAKERKGRKPLQHKQPQGKKKGKKAKER